MFEAKPALYPRPLSCRHHTRAEEVLETLRDYVATGKLRAKQMVDDPDATPTKPGRKGGRPNRAEASQKSLLGIDLTACDPAAILREIALDRSQPGSTRVNACRALLGLGDQDSVAASDAAKINERAIARMRVH
jgi:hypothetical protein